MKLIVITAFSALVFAACNIDKPTACMSLTSDYLLKDSVVEFTNCSYGADSYLWDFGDGATSTEKDPGHIYTVSDTFRVTLNVEGKYGSDHAYYTITIWELAK